MSATTLHIPRPVVKSTASVRWRRWWIAMPLLTLLCLALLWLSTAVGVGSVTLTPAQAWSALVTPETATRLEIVATNARLARALMALGVGVALGMAGALLQALYRNPLADPSITGVTQGAVTAAVAWIVFGPPVPPGQVSWVLPAVSALGALAAAILTWSVARLGGKVEPVRLILIGVLVGGVLGAITSIALLYAGEDAQVLISWLSGSLASSTWQKLTLFSLATLVSLSLLLMAIPRANVLQFGDEVAAGLGQSVTPARAIVLIAACLLTAAAVCTKLLAPNGGAVLLDGENIARLSTREMAKRLAILPQGPVAPANLTVRDLVEQGRYAQVGPFRMLRRQDHAAINRAIELVHLAAFADRDVDTLSGGERQRAWLALALAQETSVLALDEPTTFLDIGHQLEVLELVHELNQTQGLTVLMVLHDLNHAAAFSDQMVVLNRGQIIQAGEPWSILQPDLLHEVFGVAASIIREPQSGKPLIVAHSSARRAGI